jgi:hypothetical protein
MKNILSFPRRRESRGFNGKSIGLLKKLDSCFRRNDTDYDKLIIAFSLVSQAIKSQWFP